MYISTEMYQDMIHFVRNRLSKNPHSTKAAYCVPFRTRMEHILRVVTWCKRLAQDYPEPFSPEILYTAAVFHDVGYSDLPEGMEHNENSADIFHQYAIEHLFPLDFTDKTKDVIRRHSQKSLLYQDAVPSELILLMEADLLDETGALSIAWDCMAEGAEDIQSFSKTMEHIQRYTCKMLLENPCVTQKGRQYWQEKQALVQEFMRQLEFDLEIVDNPFLQQES